jgi:uncharacterized protein (TIGR01777 family)
MACVTIKDENVLRYFLQTSYTGAKLNLEKSMRILIIGATGMIGQALARSLSSHHTLVLVGRNASRLAKLHRYGHCLAYSQWCKQDPMQADYQVVINLAGQSIAGWWWTDQFCQKVLDSRVQVTRSVVAFCQKMPQPPRLIQASAIGLFPLHDTLAGQHKPYTEDDHPSPSGFLANVVKAWEREVATMAQQTVILRFGIVLSTTGGMLKRLWPSYWFGLGSQLGSGQQAISWVSLADVVALVQWLLDHPQIHGPLHVVNPTMMTQATFGSRLAKHLHRPFWLKLPSWLIRILFGQMGDHLLLKGQMVQSKRLSDLGFTFSNTFPD